MSTAIKKRNLEVKTQISETIWLEPASERTVFLQIKNTSDKDMSGLQGKIADAVKAKGYQVVTSPDKAYYWIQANVLKADKIDVYKRQLYARTQVKNVQLISMTLPDINAGCGGIDAYLGSFSFINGEQLQRFVKQIMSNACLLYTSHSMCPYNLWLQLS